MTISQLIKVKKGTPRTMDAGDNPTFEVWMGKVDKILGYCIGCLSSDLEDCLWRDWYEARMRPIWAAKKSLRNYGRD